jgi:hypothetical protein
MIVAFVGFSRIFLLGILILKGLTLRRLYKSFGVKVLTTIMTIQHLYCPLSDIISHGSEL